ncbi:hypothetical protein DLAC_11000 [Tieghemostelium lacteum]|uniref:Ankyrin repeat-containing protein n=1 Tax=Tieghemostelium lacteum TaxID=361077 RepID=A0A151Z2X3_TIELA|nr:hypothetical protein DLAC_11000 [Tieghemostelium lacteum]|eukprot:KYQ88305.1 hypothetical protein DLAC_11000 [Tieghemostelium lacteum]
MNNDKLIQRSEEIFFRVWNNVLLRKKILGLLKKYQFSGGFRTVLEGRCYSFLEYPIFRIGKGKEHENRTTKAPIEKIRHYYDVEMTSDWISSNGYFYLLADKLKNDKRFSITFKDVYRLLKHNSDYNLFLRIYESKPKLFEIANFLLLKRKCRTILDQACFAGNIEILEFIYSKSLSKCYFTNHAIDMAAKNGKMNVIRFLVEQFIGMKCIYALVYACKGGYYDIVVYLCENFPKIKHHAKAMDLAAQGGHLEILKYLYNKWGANFTSRAINKATENGHLETLKYLYSIRPNTNIKCSSKSMDVASNNGHLELIKYQMERNLATVSFYAMDSAAFKNRLDIVKYLHSKKAGCTLEALNGATLNGHIEVVKYLLNYRAEGGPHNILNTASLKGNVEIFKLLYNSPLIRQLIIIDSFNILRTAVYYGQLEIIKYLHSCNDSEYVPIFDLAVERGHLNILEFYLQTEKDVIDIPLSSYINACKYGHHQVIDLILSKNHRFFIDSNIVSTPNTIYIKSPKIVEVLTKYFGNRYWIDPTDPTINFYEVVISNDIDNYQSLIDLCMQHGIKMHIESLVSNLLECRDVNQLSQLMRTIPTLGSPLLISELKKPLLSKTPLIPSVRFLSISTITYLELLISNSIMSPSLINSRKILDISNKEKVSWWFRRYYTIGSDNSLVRYWISKMPTLHTVQPEILYILLKLPDQIIPSGIIASLLNMRIFSNGYNLSYLTKIISICGISIADMIYVFNFRDQSFPVSCKKDIIFSQCVAKVLQSPALIGRMEEKSFFEFPITDWPKLFRFGNFRPEVKEALNQLNPLIEDNLKSRGLLDMQSSFNNLNVYSTSIYQLLGQKILNYYGIERHLEEVGIENLSAHKSSVSLHFQSSHTYSSLMIKDKRISVNPITITMGNVSSNNTSNFVFKFMLFGWNIDNLDILKTLPPFQHQWGDLKQKILQIVLLETIQQFKFLILNDRKDKNPRKKKYFKKNHY